MIGNTGLNRLLRDDWYWRKPQTNNNGIKMFFIALYVIFVFNSFFMATFRFIFQS